MAWLGYRALLLGVRLDQSYNHGIAGYRAAVLVRQTNTVTGHALSAECKNRRYGEIQVTVVVWLTGKVALTSYESRNLQDLELLFDELHDMANHTRLGILQRTKIKMHLIPVTHPCPGFIRRG